MLTVGIQDILVFALHVIAAGRVLLYKSYKFLYWFFFVTNLLYVYQNSDPSAPKRRLATVTSETQDLCAPRPGQAAPRRLSHICNMASLRVCGITLFSCLFCLALTRSVDSDSRPRGVAISSKQKIPWWGPVTCYIVIVVLQRLHSMIRLVRLHAWMAPKQ